MGQRTVSNFDNLSPRTPSLVRVLVEPALFAFGKTVRGKNGVISVEPAADALITNVGL